MTSRERIHSIVAGQPSDRCGFWLGNPHADTWPLLHDYFGTQTKEQLHQQLNDDIRWIRPDTYRHPQGKPIFDVQPKSRGHSSAGVFSQCEDVGEVEDFAWPNPDYLDFTEVLQRLEEVGEGYRASGFWCPFFHNVANFFGMENYFIKMHTHPEVVHAVTSRVIEFYLEANRRFFTRAGDLVDAFFFGNDFGTQLDLLVSPDSFREFVFPYFRQLTELGHGHGYQVILHSCGSIYKVIPDLIELGVDALHPLQALATDMNAECLARDFAGKIAFMGGIDTQQLLVNGTPEAIKEDVRRVKELLGPRLIVSPSHEAILPNVPPQNIAAMAEAASE